MRMGSIPEFGYALCENCSVFRTGVFVAAAIAAVCSDTGCHNCQMWLPSSLQNWDVDVTLKEQTPAPPFFLGECQKHVFLE